MQEQYYYEIYQSIIPNLILSCYNIFQNILLCDNEKKLIIYKNINLIRDEMTNSIKKDQQNLLVYYVEYIYDYATQLVDNTNDNSSLLKDLYLWCYKLIGQLNNVINKLTQFGTYNYEVPFLKAPFVSDKFSEYSHFYDNPLKIIPLPLINFDEYSNKYSTTMDLALRRLQIYENYILTIDDKNNPTYLLPSTNIDGNTQKLIDNSQLGLSNKAIIPDDSPREGEKLAQFKIPNATPIKYGYLATKFYTPRDNTEVDTTYLRRLTKLPTKELGNVGVKVFNESLLKTSAANPIISSYLDEHLSNVKFILIMWLLEVYNNPDVKENNRNVIPSNVKQQIIDLKQNYLNVIRSRFLIETFEDPILFTTIAKIADELLILYIKKSLYAGVNNYVQGLVRRSPNIPNDVTQQIIYKSDTGFTTSLNTLFDEIVNTYHMPNGNRLDTMMYTVNVMEPEEPLPQQFKIYNPNYTSATEILEQQCYKVDPVIIDYLLNNRANPNKRDITGNSPIFYAIEMMHPEVIRKLLINPINSETNRSLVNSQIVRNTSGITPYKRALSLYSHHIGSLVENNTNVKDILDRFTQPMYKQIKDSIETNVDFKNNIIRYLDIVFPQLILMYNNLLYFYAKSYINNWSFDKQKALEQLLIQNGIIDKIDTKLPILQDFNKNVVRNSIRLDTLSRKIDLQQTDINKNQKRIDNLKNTLDSLQKELNELTSKPQPHDYMTIAMITAIDKKLDNLQQELDQLNSSNVIISNERIDTGEIVTTEANTIYTEVSRRAALFSVDEKYLGKTSEVYETIFNKVSQIYNDIFNYVIKNTSLKDDVHQTGYEDHFLYNRLWQSVINDDDKLKNIFNIHLLLSLLQKKYVDKMNNASTKQEIDTINNDLLLINDLYKSVFTPTINNMFDLPQHYNMYENYALTDVLDIITHIVSHVISANLYYAIIKTITKYLLTVNPVEYSSNQQTMALYEGHRNDYNLFIRELVGKIVNPNYDVAGSKQDARLYNYVVKEMPKLLVKQKLKIYVDDLDEERIIKSDDELFQNITNIIITNKVFPIQRDSTLINNLNDYIFKYYKNVFDLVIPRMKVVIDNYNRYILNDGRFIEIMIELNNAIKMEMS